jgi:glycosyltransferase involved in cell wall biosynthesis
VLLHSARGEHFGISVVEGMSACCIPVVHDSGGPAEIVDVEFLRYRTAMEGVLAIREALRMGHHEALRFRKKAELFSKDRFVQEISPHLARLVSS